MGKVKVTDGREVPEAVREFLQGAGVLIIDGEERPASSGATFATVDPATETTLAEIPLADASDVDAAVQAARRAHADGRWRLLAPSRRASALMKVSDALKRHANDLAWVDTLDQGKPLPSSTTDMIAASNCFRYFAGLVDKPSGTIVPSRPDRLVYAQREPIGVCAQIIPWNFPLLMASWKVAPALAFGNTVVLKPAEQTPLSAVWLIRIIHEAGVPPGVANLVQGPGEITGQALIEHRGVDKIAFTGSTEVGRHIMRTAADDLKKVTLELGGKTPNVVFHDAGDIADLAQRAAFACFYNAGETCTAGTRLLVDAAIHDELVSKVAEAASRTVVGPGWAEGSSMGPLISDTHLERVQGFVEQAASDGAELVAGGGRVETFDQGYFFQPTVFDRVGPDTRLATEEVFGPVLAIHPFDDEDEAVALANRSDFGLAAAVWTRDLARAHRVASQLEVGTVWINTHGEYDPSVSFGGYKQSGIGRELGPYAIEAYTQPKSVWVAL